MRKKIDWNTPNSVEMITSALQRGKLVAGTSDTVLGLIAPVSQQGYTALNTLKGRTNTPYLVLVGSQEQAMEYADILKRAPLRKLIEQYWPGPLTLIVPANNSVPAYATSSSHAIALRLPDHPGLQKLAHTLGGIFSTSANKTTMPIPRTIDEIDPEIAQGVSLFVTESKEQKETPSTILDCTGTEIKLIREGVYTKKRLQELLPDLA